MKKYKNKSPLDPQSITYQLNSIKEGNRAYYHIDMPHKVSLGEYYTKEIVVMAQWCKQTFTEGTWRCVEYFPGQMCFVNGSDALMFTLRWTK